MTHKIFRLVTSLMLVLAMAIIASGTQSARAAGPWYVSTAGSDANDCLSPATTCATINGAINKATAGDTINVAIGTYTGTGTEVVLINKAVNLSGGWDVPFTTQSGMSTLDGQGVRRGLTVFSVTTVEAFIIQNGSLFNTGGGIANISATLTLNNSIVRGNSTDFGGGIANISGTLTLNNSTVSGNLATTFGGGILNNGTLTLNNSTVSGNSSTTFGGGGIANSGGALTLNNSTISGNMTASSGGGILNAGGPTGTVTLNYTTVSNNLANGSGGGIANFNNMGTVTLNSSILAGNIGPGGVSDVAADCLSLGVTVSHGYNLTGSGTGCDPLGGTGDVTVTPANIFTDVLGALADNGGSTRTHALLVSLSNPAVNAIASGTNSCGSTPFDLDQRGVTRPQGAACDIGAFELEATGGVEEVTIDIKPGSQINPINPGSLGTTPVAILSTQDFNAPSEVDKASLTFGKTGDEASLAFCDKNGQDVNGDGLLDLVCHFKTKLAGFQIGDTVGALKGMTVDGAPIEGSDLVRVLK